MNDMDFTLFESELLYDHEKDMELCLACDPATEFVPEPAQDMDIAHDPGSPDRPSDTSEIRTDQLGFVELTELDFDLGDLAEFEP